MPFEIQAMQPQLNKGKTLIPIQQRRNQTVN